MAMTFAYSTSAYGQGAAPPVQPSQEAMDSAEDAFRAARAAYAAGDIRGAIAAFERVLQINPDLANIKLELGLLYQRVGQADLARSYLEAAVTAADAPESSRARARAALRMADSELSRWNFSGTVYLGGEYQTNPNASPDTVSITGPFGVPILVSGDRLDVPHGADWAAALAANVEAAFQVGDQRGSEIVASLAASHTEFDQQNLLDATFLSARLGPRIYFGHPLSPTGFIQPYVAASYLSLDRDRYFSGYGGGLVLQQQLALALTLSSQISYERRDYQASAARLTAPDQTGNYWLGLLDVAVQVDPKFRPHLGFTIERVTAREDFWSRKGFGPSLGFAAAIEPPLGPYPWVFRLDGEYRHARYDEADPLVDPDVRRREDNFELTASMSMPLARSLTLELRGQQIWNRSNLPNYRYHNSRGSLGVNYRF